MARKKNKLENSRWKKKLYLMKFHVDFLNVNMYSNQCHWKWVYKIMLCGLSWETGTNAYPSQTGHEWTGLGINPAQYR